MKAFHFRPYTLHLGRYELSRGTVVLPLPRIAMEILILLVERRGDLLTRQEIAARVWPGSDPDDVVQSINTAINRIRSTLRDEAANPKYVQTVIGKGYRFAAAVEEIHLVEEPAEPVPVRPEEPVAVGAGSRSEVRRSPGLSAPSLPLSLQPLPAEMAQTNPAVDLSAATDISDSPRSGDRRPWWLAALALLLAVVGALALWRYVPVAPAEHRGAFKLVQLTTGNAEQRVTAAAISPDGRSVAYADPHGIQLRDLDGAVHPLRAPAFENVSRIEWFPNGRQMVVSGTASSTHTPQIWSISRGDDAPHLIRENAALGVPSPDGSEVAFTSTSDRGNTTFWVTDASGGNELKVDTEKEGESYPVLLWSADAKKLILEEVGAATGSSTEPDSTKEADRSAAEHRLVVIDIQKHIETADVEGIAFEAACLWGKSGILFAGTVNKSRGTALWRVDLDPETGTPLAAPVQLQLVDRVLALSRSADGRQLAAVLNKTQPDVYVATLTHPRPSLSDVKRITSNPGQDYPQAWTPDSKSLIFESTGVGDVGTAFHIYRQTLDAPTHMEPLVSGAQPQVLPQQSPDGKWILFAGKSRWLSGDPYSLYRVPEAGGEPVKIDIGGPLDEYRCPMSGPTCILRETEGHKSFHYYALDPVTGKGRLLCSTPRTQGVLWDWSVRPGGTEIALPVPGPNGPTIRIVPCAAGTNSATRDLPVKLAQRLSGVTWAADGQGWFVTANAQTREGIELFYVAPDGTATFLRYDNPLWAVPSPDGHKLAFIGETVDSNVWTLQ